MHRGRVEPPVQGASAEGAGSPEWDSFVRLKWAEEKKCPGRVAQCLDGLQLTLLLKQDRGREPTEQGGGGGSFELV